MKKIDKRGLMTLKSNAILKKKFLDLGITRCEICGSNFGLTYMHRQKKRYYNTVEEMSDLNQVILACLNCHQSLEYDRKATEELFLKLRQ